MFEIFKIYVLYLRFLLAEFFLFYILYKKTFRNINLSYGKHHSMLKDNICIFRWYDGIIN